MFSLGIIYSQTIHPIAQVSIYGKSANAQCGYSVSDAGDFNDDGFTDVVIGARFATTDGINKTGEAYIIFGSMSYPEIIDLNNLAGSGIVVTGSNSDDQLGFCVSKAGDINGDNIDDILISATNAEITGKSNTGCVYIIYGSIDPPSVINVSSLQSAGIVVCGKNTEDELGFSISDIGDFNGDGFDDVIVGARYYSGNGEYHAGEAYIILGDSDLPPEIDLSDVDSHIIPIRLNQQNAMLGYDVSSAGDINNDGFDDVIVSANSFSVSERNFCGRCFIIYGSKNPPSEIDLEGTGSNYFSVTGKHSYDYLGTNISNAGDVNNDGYDDILLATMYNYSNEGYLFFGRNETFSDIDLGYSYPFIKTIKIDYEDMEESSAINVSDANDINKDGFGDIMISLPSLSYGGFMKNGEVFILNGSDSLPETINLSSYNKLEIKNYSDGSFFGSSISSLTDFNNDGFADVIVGAYKVDYDGKTDCGEATIFLLGYDAFVNVPYEIYK
jgi:hypothetical protein